MATDNPRITFTLSEDMRRMIDDFKFDHRIKNQTQAIVALIDIGLKELADNHKDESDTPSITPEEEAVLAAYRAAEPTAQQYALDMLVSHPASKKELRA